MNVYDIREDTAGRWYVVRIDLDTGQATYITWFDTRLQAQRNADHRNLEASRS
jgi:hypothetical protein